ncbi:class I tRNA ligase family protein [Catellatospora sp. KI3]|uniref:methionine--tRNA ligase n=1 Tax=Catellatospora sp. KI3 TaxID=3041620 RepID=UPI002482FECD|nr:class I tRNA ligase family protein [Catellatospora sp. KI3]MDI1460788.1 class I tRNA ligase family protein [Catellatospora sp. KI3]
MRSLTAVTAAPPTPNGDLHLGHVSGPYLGADVYARAARLRGGEAYYVTGSDLHQSYVPAKARREGVDPLVMAEGYADEIAEIFTSAAFATAAVVRPQHTPEHTRIVTEFFARLDERGALREVTEPLPHCATCDRYLFEAHLTGRCPHCGVACDGNSCENCALPNNVSDLVDAVCNVCKSVPTTRLGTRLVLPLAEYADRLRAYHASTVMSPQLEALCADMLAAGLPDIPVTHPTDWGLPMPGHPGQRIYVWGEMVPGYFAELAQATTTADWRSAWDRAEVVQFFGFDNGYFHAVLFPALMMAYDPGLKLPSALLTNEFYLLGDTKFSTSRRHAIWATDLLAQVPGSVVRFVLSHDRPEVARTSFGWDRFHALADGELAENWQGWLSALFERVTAAGGRVPSFAAATRSQHEFLLRLDTVAQDILSAYDAAGFSTRRAARGLVRLVAEAVDFAAAQSRRTTQLGLSAEATGSAGLAVAAAAVAAELAAARTLAQVAYPLMPEFAQRLWTALGEAGAPRWIGTDPPPAGQEVDTTAVFFTRLPGDLEQTVMKS